MSGNLSTEQTIVQARSMAVQSNRTEDGLVFHSYGGS